MAELTDEERVARAAAKADPEFARRQFNTELDERRFMDAAGTFMVALYHRAVAMMKAGGFGISWEQPPDEGYRVVTDIVEVLSKAVEELGDSAPSKLLIAFETFAALANTQAILEGRDQDCETDSDRTAKLILAAAGMGKCDLLINLFESGHFKKFGNAEFKIFRLGEGQRGRQAAWEVAFLPVAVAYCAGKQKVTLAKLRREARKWANEVRAAGNNPGLPDTDKGIDDGVKRMEASGGLSIPGRTGGN